MPPNPTPSPDPTFRSAGVIHRLLGSLSIFTMLMTIPQALTIWVNHRAAGISVVSWSAYLVSAVVWLGYGLQKHDKNIYLPCIGWILLDSAVIVGALFTSNEFYPRGLPLNGALAESSRSEGTRDLRACTWVPDLPCWFREGHQVPGRQMRHPPLQTNLVSDLPARYWQRQSNEADGL